MLRSFGVQGVKVHEVFSLDDDFLNSLPSVNILRADPELNTDGSNSRPVYGLIFLFKWVEEDPDRQEQSCPEAVWFANQVSRKFQLGFSGFFAKEEKTISNACASVAMLNIVNNVPNIELGENLQAFKEFTASFSPALRGDAIANFDFVMEIHNSFAR